MSILASLARAYERLPDAPAFGYSMKKIGFAISLNPDGSPATAPIDLRVADGKKLLPLSMLVPQPAKRTVAISPNFLWDKTSYTLGVTRSESKRVADEHAAFVKRHLVALDQADDEGLKAFGSFLTNWSPEMFAKSGWPEDMKDQNVIFALESDRLDRVYLHDRPAARALWTKVSAETEKSRSICLVSGEQAPIARLHPAIKGVWGAQSSGASIVSFNLDAFTSYGHEQGDNAPISEAMAFAYTTALNLFLREGSKHRLQIGDTSVVFWADASDTEAARDAESLTFAMFAEVSEEMQSEKVGTILQAIRSGKPLREVAPQLESGVRFFVLGLAPNAARISIRFWYECDFRELAENYRRFVEDTRIEPAHSPYPAFWKYLLELAVQEKRENVPPNLAGDWFRSVLAGNSYPLTLLTSAIARLRAGEPVNYLRAAIIKSVLVRNFKLDKEAPVALDRDNPSAAYQLGRLFAVLERFQTLALGKEINCTIRDRYYGSASATPRDVFPVLLRLNIHHQSKAEQGDTPRLGGYFAKQLGEIMGRLPPEFPSTLSLQQQGQFAIGYYHQSYARKDADDGNIKQEKSE